MADKYFIRRSSLFVKLRYSNGKLSEWTPCAEGGLLKTGDAKEAKELLAMQKEHRGGITEITEAEYEDFKKKPALKRGQSWQPTATAPLPELSPTKKSSAPSAPSPSVAAAATEPATAPSTQDKPSTAKGVFDEQS